MILLVAINAKYIHSNLAVYCLKAYSADKKVAYSEQIQIAEYTINHRTEDILQGIYQKKPTVVAFSCYIWNREYVLEVAESLKKVLPGVFIIVGGPEVSYDAEKTLTSYSFIDLVMLGEGEKTFYELMNWMEESNRAVVKTDEKLCRIPGLAYRRPGAEQNILFTEPREMMILDEVVFPYRDMRDFENKILYYETSRGCPFSCSYCLSSVEKCVRLRSLSLVEKELSFFVKNRVPQVKFVDRTFNCNHDHAFAIWEWIGTHDNGVTNFHFEIGADLLRKEDFELFRTFRKGLIQLEIGVQSTQDVTIQEVCRKMDLTQLEQAVAKVREAGNIHQHLDLIAGLPYEGYERFGKSFDDVYAMKPDQLQLGFLKVLKGSEMERRQNEYGLVTGSKPPYEVMATKWLSYDEVIRLKQIEDMVEVYYNSFQFTESLVYLLMFHDSPFSLFEQLAKFYVKNHINSIAHSRLSRYTILQQYFFETVQEVEERERFTRALTYDFYSRERAKKSLPFAQPPSDEIYHVVREWLHTIGKKEAHGKEIVYFSGEIGCTKKEGFYVFDYEMRNPLNHSAQVTFFEKPPHSM